ncbi:MAG: ferritin-like domain-containing protein [Candidatus Binatia bacterium]
MSQEPADYHVVDAVAPAIYTHNFTVQDQDMRSLYEKAKRDQWNASQDIDWSQSVDPDQGILPDGLIDIYETPYWTRLSRKQQLELNRQFSSWRISQLMYGEEGALLICSQLATLIPGIDAKFFMATQVMDEARHSEVLARYLQEKIGVVYPFNPNLRRLFDLMLETPQWYLKTVGTQLIAETVAVSLFRMLAEHSPDGLMREICRRILADESRHMGFGMLSLPDQVAELSGQERREVEDFTCEALVLSMQGQFPQEAYEAVGFNNNEIAEIKQLRHQIAQKREYMQFRQYFKRDFHSALWNNLTRTGLLSERAIERLTSMGVVPPQATTQTVAA